MAGEVYDDVEGTYLSLAQGGADYLGADIKIKRSDISLTESYLGEGYSKPTSGAMEAIDLFATTEGILLDPVYSAKAGAALIDMARSGKLKGPTIFWNTGGYHAFFDPHFSKQCCSGIERLAAIQL